MAKPKVTPRMSDEAVQAKTDKTWAEWFALLDKAGARQMDHPSMVAYLEKNHGLGAWWDQMVTVSYEQARGMRQKHEKPEGFEISVSKTVAVPVAELFEAWENPKRRARWLDEAIVIRKATPSKYLRIAWSDDRTHVAVNFYSKGQGKSQVSAQHSKLPNAKAAERMKAYWAGKLAQLRQCLEA